MLDADVDFSDVGDICLKGITVATTALRSRMSPTRDRSLLAISSRMLRLGSVAGASEKPVTSAPIRVSHAQVHAPLKPVWPVSRTRLPRQKSAFGIGPSLPRRISTLPQAFEVVFVAQRVHRVPEAVMLVGCELAGLRQRL